MSIFKSYDIRGVYGREWDARTAYLIGRTLPDLLQARTLLLGRDARLSSGEILEALSRGLLEAGCRVTDAGLCTTPSVYFATAHFGFQASVMITASHNPPEYNGLKVSRAGAVPVGYDTGLAELERRYRRPPAAAAQPGQLDRLDVRTAYLQHLRRFTAGIGPIRAVVDCSDGMASLYIHELATATPAELLTMYDVPDGRFPHHAPNPLEERNLADLKARTVAEKAALGICFDGDADRVMFVDETGRFVSPDLITGLLGYHFFRDGANRGQAVTYDVRTSRAVVELVQELGGRPLICKVGHSHAKKLLRESGGIYGGELAGHYYFRDNYFCDSGLIAAALVLSVLSDRKRKFSQVMAGIRRYHGSGEINFRVEQKDRIIEEMRGRYRQGRLTEIDGIRLDFPGWWFNLRKSNTEPFLRLVVETADGEECRLRTEELIQAIREIDPSAKREQ